MTPAQFQNVALDIARNYWRIKAASALYRLYTEDTDEPMEYANVPSIGIVTNLFTSEPSTDAMSALQDFILLRFPKDLLLALIAEFESRLGTRLSALGRTSSGTLGTLQRRIENGVTVAPTLINDLTEIRERRNAMIHHGGKADSKYVTAAAAVLPRAHPHVKSVALGDDVNPDSDYLTYATDVLIRYSNAIG